MFVMSTFYCRHNTFLKPGTMRHQAQCKGLCYFKSSILNFHVLPLHERSDNHFNQRGKDYIIIVVVNEANLWANPMVKLTWSCWGAGWGPSSEFPEHYGGVSGHWAAAWAGGGTGHRPHAETELSAGAPWLLTPKRQSSGLSSQMSMSSFVCLLVLTWRTRASCRARYIAICASWGSNDEALWELYTQLNPLIMMWKWVQQLSKFLN